MKLLMTLISLTFSLNAFALNSVCIDLQMNKYLQFSNSFSASMTAYTGDVLTQKESEEITNREIARMTTEIQAKMNPICNNSKEDADDILEAFSKACKESLPSKEIDKGAGHTQALLSRFCRENAQHVQVFIAGLDTNPKCDKEELVDSSGRDKIKVLDDNKRLPPPPSLNTISK